MSKIGDIIKLKNKIEEKSCLGKVAHKSMLAAEYVLHEMENYTSLEIYKCQFCKMYHIGHIPKKKKK